MVHIGQNIAKIRGLKRMTQKELAAKLEMTQPEYSRIEQRTQINDDLLEKIAEAMDVPQEAIKDLKEDAIFTNNVYDQNNVISQVYFQLNPLEKIVSLYEQLLKEKDTLIGEYRNQLNKDK